DAKDTHHIRHVGCHDRYTKRGKKPKKNPAVPVHLFDIYYSHSIDTGSNKHSIINNLEEQNNISNIVPGKGI
ncbi:MAG: hypothetical protein ABIB93_02915, partial [Chloroflexota bacterium]